MYIGLLVFFDNVGVETLLRYCNHQLLTSKRKKKDNIFKTIYRQGRIIHTFNVDSQPYKSIILVVSIPKEKSKQVLTDRIERRTFEGKDGDKSCRLYTFFCFSF